ncbi:hypothetical protein SKP52_23785 (plasmid) [Sphingopyxis fribergensis]|uniref:Uncharacterized protein n=1 Tax=Sphingopyxis fribergensis TaxID=1515612 RepID=A0A0A7PNM0_9SPHN|nr:hypothetical protein SKP52_23785 [Sphingopyxis fribergensis]PAL19217.1 hypothetical protein CD928_22175 [Sphingopyxis sp. GW247-27LB]
MLVKPALTDYYLICVDMGIFASKICINANEIFVSLTMKFVTRMKFLLAATKISGTLDSKTVCEDRSA